MSMPMYVCSVSHLTLQDVLNNVVHMFQDVLNNGFTRFRTSLIRGPRVSRRPYNKGKIIITLSVYSHVASHVVQGVGLSGW